MAMPNGNNPVNVPNNNAEVNPNANEGHAEDWNEVLPAVKIARVMAILQPYIPNHHQRLQAVSALTDRQLMEYAQGSVRQHLANGVFTIEEILPISGEVLYEITGAPHCITALENGDVTLQELVEMGADTIYETYFEAFAAGQMGPH